MPLGTWPEGLEDGLLTQSTSDEHPVRLHAVCASVPDVLGSASRHPWSETGQSLNLGATLGALAERLPKAISRGSKQVSGRAKPLPMSVNGVVDRRGVEPLTSAVQILTNALH